MHQPKGSPPALSGAERAKTETRDEAVSESENTVVSSDGNNGNAHRAEASPGAESLPGPFDTARLALKDNPTDTIGVKPVLVLQGQTNEEQPSSETTSENGAEPTDEKAKPNGGGPRARKTKKAKQEEPTELWPDEAQPAPEMPKAERTEADYAVDDIIADDSDEDDYSTPAPSIPKLIDKFPKSKFIRVRGGKEYLTQVWAAKLDEDDQRPGEISSYILTKKTRDFFINELEYRVAKMNVCDLVTIQGQQFLYMYPATSSLSSNSWNTSRARVLEAAVREWIIVTSKQDERIYDYRTRNPEPDEKRPPKPAFPTEPINQRVLRAVKGGRLIDTTDHPVVKRLLGIVEDNGDDG
jgi:hypothetical protein